MSDLSPGLLRSAAAIVRVQAQARGKPHWAGVADRLDAHADTLTPPRTEPDTEEQP